MQQKNPLKNGKKPHTKTPPPKNSGPPGNSVLRLQKNHATLRA